jgi:hypothetical protein
MSRETEIIQTEIRRFQEAKDLQALRRAVNLLVTACPQSTRTETAASDLDFARAWIAFFEVIDGAKEPSFDFSRRPALKLGPPRDSNGATYPAGVSPKEIQDPGARREYEAALAGEAAYARGYRLQSWFDRDEKRAGEGPYNFARFFRESVAAFPDLRSQIEALVASSALSAARKQQLLAALR